MDKPSFTESLNTGLSNLNPQDLFPDSTKVQELNSHWTGLQYLGLEMTFTENALLCNHQEYDFHYSIPYDLADSDELRRDLFGELRRCFGNFSDRYFSVLFQPSQQVDTLYDSFRALLPACNSIARSQTWH